MELSEDLLCLFNAQVEERDDSFIVEIPKRELTTGDVEAGGVYRVGMLPRARQSTTSEPNPGPGREQGGSEPPVAEGDVEDVEIEDIGDQGDGIARIGPGYVIIIPGTERGERLSVEITEVRDNMAFANIVERHDRMR